VANDFGYNDKSFHRWLSLGTELANAKEAKDWEGLIVACHSIIELDVRAKHIGIFVPRFLKKIAKAYSKLNDHPRALENYRLAKEAFENYRKTATLNKPDDWLDEIAKMDKEILKITG
jgi:hypothetical protein